MDMGHMALQLAKHCQEDTIRALRIAAQRRAEKAIIKRCMSRRILKAETNTDPETRTPFKSKSNSLLLLMEDGNDNDECLPGLFRIPCSRTY
eukprot:5490608-Amphidinium_carterae.1